jgi:hypothetical protein
LRERYAGQPNVASARLRAIARCLAAAGWADGTPPRLDAARDADWARVRAGKITVACPVAALDGVPYQVAIALATWPAGDEREAGGPAESGHGASKDTGPANDEPSSRPAGTGGRLRRPGDTPGRHSVVS